MINKKYLPSKKFVMALSIAVVVILIAIILNFWKPNVTEYKNVALSTDTNATSSVINIDSDNDGLPDWKEGLYGTDPKKADTDGDGTTDETEITLSRDPLKANTAAAGQEPNDKIDPTIVEKNQKMVEEYQNLNAAEKMSRELMSNFFAVQPINGQALDQTTINSIAQQSIQNIPQKEYTGITKESDLNLIKVDEKTFNKDILAYAKSYYSQTEVFRKIAGQDLNLINNCLSTGKYDKIGMAKITSQYQSIINNLIKTPVPAINGSSGAINHLILINDLEKLIKIDNNIIDLGNKDMASVFSDLSVYNSTTNDLMIVLSTLDGVLKINR